jgi:hypothetical protein
MEIENIDIDSILSNNKDNIELLNTFSKEFCNNFFTSSFTQLSKYNIFT